MLINKQNCTNHDRLLLENYHYEQYEQLIIAPTPYDLLLAIMKRCWFGTITSCIECHSTDSTLIELFKNQCEHIYIYTMITVSVSP